MRKKSGVDKNRTSLEMGKKDYSDLEKYCHETESTIGRMISRLVQIFGNLHPKRREMFTKWVKARIRKLLQLREECPAFEKATYEEQIRYYEALLWYLTEDAENIEEYAQITGEKKRTTLDLTPENYTILSGIASKYDITFGEAVGLLIRLFISMPGICRKDLLFFSRNQLRQILMLDNMTGAMEAGENERAIHDYQTISYFFESGILPLSDNSKANMDRIYLKYGYVEHPADWIHLPDVLGKDEECMYAGVIETRNGNKYGVPHFVFASPYKHGREYTDADERKVFDAAIKAWPQFKEILNKHVKAVYGENGLIENEKEYMEAPYSGIFAIYSEDDIEMKILHHGEPPYGAKIVCERKEE